MLVSSSKFIIFASLVAVGCSTSGPTINGNPQVVDFHKAFINGDVLLECRLACSGKWGANRRDLKDFHDREKWSNLSSRIMEIGYQSDLSYYYLGRAAEGLGHPSSAQKYYYLSLAAAKCAASINVCDGFIFPRDTNLRLAELAAASRVASSPPKMGEFESTRGSMVVVQPRTSTAMSADIAKSTVASKTETSESRGESTIGSRPQTPKSVPSEVAKPTVSSTSNFSPQAPTGAEVSRGNKNLATFPAQLTSGRIPKGHRGTSIFEQGASHLPTSAAQALDNSGLTRLIQKNKNLEISKGRFETLDQLRKRLGHLEQAVEATFTPTKRSDRRDVSYNHAAQRMTVRLVSSSGMRRVVMFDDSVYGDGHSNADPSRAVLPSDRLARPMYSYFIVGVKPRTTRKYQGSNAFGATATVTAHTREQYGFIVLNMISNQLDTIQVDLDVPAQIVEQLAGQLVWRFTGTTSIGQWETPRSGSSPEWAFRDYYLKEATIDWPTDYMTTTYLAPMLVNKIELVNQTTGEVKRSFVVQQ